MSRLIKKWIHFSQSGVKITLKSKVLADLVEVLDSRSYCVSWVTSRVKGCSDQKCIHFLESGVKITLGSQVFAGLVEVLGSRSHYVARSLPGSMHVLIKK